MTPKTTKSRSNRINGAQMERRIHREHEQNAAPNTPNPSQSLTFETDLTEPATSAVTANRKLVTC